MDKKIHSITAYILGIISIVLAIFTPLAGIVLGIVGLVQSKKEKSDLSKRARKLNIIGIVLGVILLIVSLALASYLAIQGLNTIPGLPA